MITGNSVDADAADSVPKNDVGDWLDRIALPEYAKVFKAFGFDSMRFLDKANETDIEDMINHPDIGMKPFHRRVFLSACSEVFKERHSCPEDAAPAKPAEEAKPAAEAAPAAEEAKPFEEAKPSDVQPTEKAPRQPRLGVTQTPSKTLVPPSPGSATRRNLSEAEHLKTALLIMSGNKVFELVLDSAMKRRWMPQIQESPQESNSSVTTLQFDDVEQAGLSAISVHSPSDNMSASQTVLFESPSHHKE